MKREKASNWSPEFQRAIEESGLADDINRCMFCGKCTGICPVAAINPSYSPRQIIRELLLGNHEQVLHSEEIWRCFWCANCLGYCPSDIKYPLIMLALRYYALEHGSGKKYATLFTRFVKNAYKDAVTFQPGKPQRLDQIKAMRTSIGLVPLRIVSDKGKEEYRKLYEITGTLEWLDNLHATEEVPLKFSFETGKLILGDFKENRSNLERGV
jgi:heterodisulfide reductase subunit C